MRFIDLENMQLTHYIQIIFMCIGHLIIFEGTTLST
jgi:hypothetical protein